MAGGGVADQGADARVQQGGADRRGDDDEHRAGGRPSWPFSGLASPASVADDAQHQRVAPGGVVGGRGEVGEQAGAEADEGAADMAVHQGEAEHGEQQQVGYGAGQVEPGEHAHLDHQGDDHQRGRRAASG